MNHSELVLRTFRELDIPANSCGELLNGSELWELGLEVAQIVNSFRGQISLVGQGLERPFVYQNSLVDDLIHQHFKLLKILDIAFLEILRFFACDKMFCLHKIPLVYK